MGTGDFTTLGVGFMQPESYKIVTYQQVPNHAALPGVSQQPSGTIGSGPNPATPAQIKLLENKTWTN